MKRKVVSVVGARPQFIKAAPLSRELRTCAEEVLVHTGQHYDVELSQTFFEELHLPRPDYNLGVGSGSQGYQTGAMVQGIEDVLLKEEPDITLVYGDTNSTLAGALAAVKLHIPLAHVEAGLRSFNKKMPEEVNRVVADHCADLLFCPTRTAVDNLSRENIRENVYLTGDVMYDALLFNLDLARTSPILEELEVVPREYLLTTIHRQSNTDDPEALRRIVTAFARVEKKVVFPVHPRTRKALSGSTIPLSENVISTAPLGYLDFLKLESEAAAILTDSGGVQKEAYLLGVPCITLREETEWVETVEEGWNVLAGTDTEKIVKMAKTLTPKNAQRQLFGDGTAAQKIVTILLHHVF